MKRGFTLIELLTVVIIIGVLSSVAVPQYRRSLERSRLAEAQEILPALSDAWDRYKVEHPTDPSSWDLLDVTMKGKKINGGWRTANYDYVRTYFSGTYFFKAVSRKGKYEGTVILYDGESFSCVNSKTKPGGCEVFNLPIQEGYTENPYY